ncbi:hypothetical protein [Lactococcus lactis]|uniref:Deoxyhypusine synthase n=1 Tax=Lactococcus lactis TaxID=1358 RepID=A0AAW5TUY0_9LACT|nr:hypothetical protein [Lactococcus lactis]MCW2281394.1 deoxyhypusine synthase [Lactococcus lactis]
MKKDKRDKLLDRIHKLITIDNDYNENAHFIYKILSEILNGQKIVTKKYIEDRNYGDTKND